MPHKSKLPWCVVTVLVASISLWASGTSPESRLEPLVPGRAEEVLAGDDVSQRAVRSVRARVIDPRADVQDATVADDIWTTTGSMLQARWLHTATLLFSGKVLVVGGGGDSVDDSSRAELYDAATGTWSPTGSLIEGRDYHTATLLRSGKVLLVGRPLEGDSATAELYDPATEVWSPTGSPTPRYWHTATLLHSGKVLVAGGYSDRGGALASAELYDPATGTWSPTGSLSRGRLLAAATLLPSGKVLVAGGQILYNGGPLPGYAWVGLAEVYDPATGTWSPTGSLKARELPTATLLRSGKVLVAGGGATETAAELYDEETGTWTATGSLSMPHQSATTTLLPSGKVLVAGGLVNFGPPVGSIVVANAELYDPGTGTWETTGSLATARYYHTATLLRGGAVLVAGGTDGGILPEGILASAEVYNKGTGSCAIDVTGDVDVFRFPVQHIPFNLFRFQWVIIHNRTNAPVAGPLTLVMADLQNAVFIGSPLTTTCYSPESDPFLLVSVGIDNVLSANESRLTGLWFFKTHFGHITYTPQVLSGIPTQ